MCSNVSLMPTSMHFLHGSSLLLPIRLACDGSKLWLAARPTTALQLFWNRVSKKHACFSSAAEVLRNIVAFEVLWANKNYKKVIKCYKIFYFFYRFSSRTSTGHPWLLLRWYFKYAIRLPSRSLFAIREAIVVRCLQWQSMQWLQRHSPHSRRRCTFLRIGTHAVLSCWAATVIVAVWQNTIQNLV